MTGRFDEATAVLEEAIGHADAVARRRRRARTLVLLLVRPAHRRAGGWRTASTSSRRSPATIGVFEAAGDEAGLAMAWRLLAWAAGTACRFGDAAEASRACESSTPARAGDVRQERRAATAYAAAASLGPTLVDEAIAPLRVGLEQTAGDRQSEGNLLAVLAGLYAMQGDVRPRARRSSARGRALFEELGLDVDAARARDGGVARRDARGRTSRRPSASSAPRYDALDAVGERTSSRPSPGCSRRRCSSTEALDEASELCDRSRELATDADVATQALWRCVRGRILARRARTPRPRRSSARRSRCSSRPTRSCSRSRPRSTSARCSRPAAARGGARGAYEAARGLAEREGRRRDPRPACSAGSRISTPPRTT